MPSRCCETAHRSALRRSSGTTWSFADAGLSDATWSYTARVVDAAGNRGNAGSAYSIVVDGTAPARALAGAGIIDNVSPTLGTVRDGGSTNDTRPELRLTLDSVLASGETLRIYRATGSANPVLVQQFSQRDDEFSFTDSTLARNNTYTYSADVVDAAGNVARLALDYSITVI